MTNEQITLHTESLDKIVQTLRNETNRTGNPTPRTVANTIQAQRATPDSTKAAIGLTGLPGAGKSFAGEILAEAYDSRLITMGDAIREQFQTVHGRTHDDSEELADFASTWRENAPQEIPGVVTDLAENTDDDPVIIDGVRSPTDYYVLNDHFEDFYLIDVQAPFEIRLDRVTDRGREGEDEFGRVNLAERDEHELANLGQHDLREEIGVDLVLTNNGGEERLRRRLQTLTEENLPFDVVDEEPLSSKFDIQATVMVES